MSPEWNSSHGKCVLLVFVTSLMAMVESKVVGIDIRLMLILIYDFQLKPIIFLGTFVLKYAVIANCVGRLSCSLCTHLIALCKISSEVFSLYVDDDDDGDQIGNRASNWFQDVAFLPF